MPASFSHTLRSTVQRCGPTIDCCESSLTTPGGSGQAWNLRVFLSNFTIPDWNMCEIHRLPSASTSRSSVPLGKFGRCSGIGNSVYFKLAGSKRPRNCSSNCENQTMPSPSTMTSCGINGFLGSSYSVMTARVHLRPLDVAVVGVARHALHYLPEPGGVVLRFRHPLQRVAADAAVEKLLLVWRSREARQPFGVGELGAQVLRLAQLELERSARAVGQLGGERAFELVARGADAKRIVAGLELRRREAETSRGVAHHADADAGARFLRAHHHAFQRAFRRNHPPRKLRKRREGEAGGYEQQKAHLQEQKAHLQHGSLL